MRRTISLCALVLIFTIAQSAAAATLRGRVVTGGGAGLAGITVALEPGGATTVTDSEGRYRFSDVAAGPCAVTFSRNDTPLAATEVTIGADRENVVDQRVDAQFGESMTVSAPSRRAERIVDAPAAVATASRERIDEVASTGQLPQTLVGLTGVDSVQSGLYDFNFSTRGFNRPLSRRVLTLVDGRDTSFAFLSAQEWGALSLPMDQFASAEFVRGPTSALYGANSYGGVISFTSKKPSESAGGFLRVTGGELSTSRVEASHSGALNERWTYRAAGSYRSSGDFAQSRLVSVEYPGVIPDAVPLRRDGVDVRAGTLRVDGDLGSERRLTIEGGSTTLNGALLVLPIGRVQSDVTRPWARANFNTPSSNLLAYYDARHGQGQVLTSGAAVSERSFNARLEWQGNHTFGTRAFVVGGASIHKQVVDDRDANGLNTLLSNTRNERQAAIFGQVDLAATDRLRVIAAARYDHSTIHDPQFSPKLGIQYALTPSQNVRLNYSAGFQSANYAEIAVAVPVALPVDLSGLEQALAPLLGGTRLGFESIPILSLGNENLRVEKVRSIELGYSGSIAQRALVTIDTYRSTLTDFITEPLFGVNPAYAPYAPPSSLSPQAAAVLLGALQSELPPSLFSGLTNVNGHPAFVLSFTNAGRVTTQGVEAGVDVYLNPRWSAEANYSWFDYHVDEGIEGSNLLPNTPTHKLNAGVRFHGARWSGSARYRWVDAFAWESGLHHGDVPSYGVVDVAAKVPFGAKWDASVNVANALDNHHYEIFGGDVLRRLALVSLTYRW